MNISPPNSHEMEVLYITPFTNFSKHIFSINIHVYFFLKGWLHYNHIIFLNTLFVLQQLIHQKANIIHHYESFLRSYKKLKKLFFAFYQLHRQIIFCRSIISSITIAIINIFTIICYFITIKSSEMTTRFFNDNLRSTSIPFFCISA